jgi:dihydroneopterin aldolase
MTLLLASVSGVQEAEIALAHGADIIDLKDPRQGALAALSPDDVRAAVAAVAGRRPVSTVTGDLPMQPDVIMAAATRMAEVGVDYVKVGLFADARREACIRALAPLARRTKTIGVMFADAGADDALLPLMAESGFAGAMLDTARKQGGGLFDHRDIPALADFVAACRRHGLLAGLAGSLEPPDIPRLLLLEPDYLGFRGALCGAQGRAAEIDADAIDLLRGLIPLDPRSAGAGPRKVDFRLLAARGYAGSGSEEAGTDTVFVRDFVLPVRIGAYARERQSTQNVRFAVEATVPRGGQARDMRDVLSYDLITDGIRMLVARGHVPLVETLAEQIAAFVLARPRVLRATVRVEKLEVGSGTVGIEITRERPAEVAKVHQLYPGAGVTDPQAGR